MVNTALEKFGCFLIKNFRDQSIEHYDGLASLDDENTAS